MSPDQQAILDLLDAKEGEKAGIWTAHCPCPDNHKNGDRKPSLSILMGDDGWLHANCHAGCHRDAVRAAVGRPVSEWGPGVRKGHPSGPSQISKPVAWYAYRDLRGRLQYEVVRYEPKNFRRRRPHPEHPSEWVWGLTEGEYVRLNREWVIASKVKNAPANAPRVTIPAQRLIPYRVREWYTKPLRTPIIVPEGEKAVDTLFALGFLATTMPGGSVAKDYAYFGQHLAGRRVIIWRDNDAAGENRVAEMLPGLLRHRPAELRVIEPPSDREKGWDVTDLAIELSSETGWPTTDKAVLNVIRSAVIDIVKETPAYTLNQLVKS